MNRFVNPEITIKEFEVEDVVTVSGTGVESGENELPYAPFSDDFKDTLM